MTPREVKIAWLVRNITPLAVILTCITTIALIAAHMYLPQHPEQQKTNDEFRERLVSLERAVERHTHE